ncbi:hypothetical protein SASPL_101450 [Salvia splendens]|uniref:Neprosin activation peptide domain-containing protein n=1 Tax=Salvia splendens TaxID=180675 RepID=A0A8X8YQW3_SALSN|nr:hypothetical protein SASPL_101450 [Salvia splendens]
MDLVDLRHRQIQPILRPNHRRRRRIGDRKELQLVPGVIVGVILDLDHVVVQDCEIERGGRFLASPAAAIGLVGGCIIVGGGRHRRGRHRISSGLRFAAVHLIAGGGGVNVQIQHFTPQCVFSPDGDIFDCVLTHQQPAFDHPLLQCQMPMDPPERPKGLRTPPTTSDTFSENFQTWTLSDESCPKNTIPIRRTTEQDLLRASSIRRFGRKISSPETSSPKPSPPPRNPNLSKFPELELPDLAGEGLREGRGGDAERRHELCCRGGETETESEEIDSPEVERLREDLLDGIDEDSDLCTCISGLRRIRRRFI